MKSSSARINILTLALLALLTVISLTPSASADFDDSWLSEKADSGGYAHLITACAQYLLYKTNRTDWQTADIPDVLAQPDPD